MKTIAFYQLKGGVGKTASAVNIAYLAAIEGIRTVIWDIDPQGAVSWYLPEANRTSKTSMSDVVKGKKSISPLIRPTRFNYLDHIPADMSLRNADIFLEKSKAKTFFTKLISVLSEDYRLLVIDSAPSISNVAEQLFEVCDNLYMPLIPSHLSVNSYDKVHHFFKQQDLAKKKLHTFFTMVDRRKKVHNEFIAEPPIKLKKPMSCFVPYSAEVEKMGLHQAPLGSFSPSSSASLAYNELWLDIKKHNRL